MKPYLVLFCSFFCVAFAHSQFQLSWRETIPGINARSSSGGDVDGDGDLDILVTQIQGASRIYLNDGNGGFSIDPDAVPISEGGAGELGDLDGDGDLDIFIAGEFDGSKVYLNDGVGNFFDTGQSLGISSQRSAVALADIDGDNDLDAIVPTNDSSKDNRIFLNNGDAVFSDANLSLGFHFTREVEVIDIDGDGDRDIFFGNNRNNTLWKNNGNGTFTETNPILTSSFGNSTYDIEFGFLNADSHLDAWVANSSLAGQADKVFFGDGTGSFTQSSQSFPANGSLAVALNDIDNDGDTDALIGTFFSKPDEIWLNDGTGVFTLSAFPMELVAVRDFVVADLDGDLDDDYFFMGSNNPSTVWKSVPGSGISLINTGQRLGSFEASCVDQGDFDNDADIDIVLGNVDGGLHLLQNNGSGQFSDSGNLLYTEQGSGNGAVAVADLDGDSDLDIFDGAFSSLAGAMPANRVWLNNGSGHFTLSGSSYGEAETYAVLAVNVDGDSDIDILVGNRDVFGETGQNVVLINDGSGEFSSNHSLGLGDTKALAAAELDGNPGIDVFVGNEGPNVVWFGNGSGGFADSGQVLASNNTQKVLLKDFDGDSDIDAYCANSTGGNKLWLNNGSGVFTLSTNFVGFGTSRDAVAFDADEDGDFDIWLGFGGTFGSESDQLWLNDGSGGFSLDSSYQLQRTRGITVADFNNDGDQDVFAASADGDHIVWATGGQAIVAYAESFGLVGDDTLPLVDPDGDGVLNFEEMAFNMNPNFADANLILNLADSSSGLPNLNVVPLGAEFEFVAETIRLINPIDISYELRSDDDLSLQVVTPTSISTSVISGNATYQRATYRYNPPGMPSKAFGQFGVRYSP